MKIILMVAVVISAVMASFGGVDDTLISFSTRGPDKYLDGTTVKDGECYALVWTCAGATFAGIAADGTAVGDDSRVLVFAPLAKGGRCPTTLFELDAALAAKYAGGSYEVYLVDTRLANGALGGVGANGLPVAVNGYGKAKGEGEETSQTSQTSQTSVSVTTRSALPANAPQPQITAIRIIGDNVFLTVKNTLPCLQYAAKEVNVEGQGAGITGEPSCDSTSQTSTQGAATTDGEITVITPKKGASGFYSVDRK